MNMGRIPSGAVFVLVIVLAWISWMFRFELQVVTNQDGYVQAYRLDRWTGNTRLLDSDQWYPVTEGNPDDLRATPSATGTPGFGLLR